VVVFERHLRLRMQRGRHVDGVAVALGAFEPDIFGAGVGADAREEFRQRRALPGADGAPTFDADVAGDLRHLGQRVQLGQRPRFLVVEKTVISAKTREIFFARCINLFVIC